jgi:type I restriction enzyme S subunit
MTVSELRVLVDNLEEYIQVPGGIERLRKTILHLAVSGQLVPQDPSEGTGEQLYTQIQAERQKLIAEGKLKKQKSLPEITEEEIPFEIPESWRWVRLEELCWLEQGSKTKNQTHNILDAKYLRGRREPFQKEAGFLVERYDRIILVDGENSGEVFVAPEKGYLGSTFKKLRINGGICVEYLDIILTNLKEEMRQNKIGAAIPHLDKKLFASKPTSLSPLSEQQRIVKKTAQLLNLVDKLKIT